MTSAKPSGFAVKASTPVRPLSARRVVNPAELGSYTDYSLYEGWTLKGWPVRTIVRGVTVMDEGKLVGAPGYGKYLKRSLHSA